MVRRPGGLSKWLGRRSPPDTRAIDAAFAAGSESDGGRGGAGADALLAMLNDIQRLALDIYAQHGLPTRPGQYELSPRGRRWKFLGADLTAEQRFTHALTRPSASGWKFAALEDLGTLRPDVPDLVNAAWLLTHGDRLRKVLRDGRSLSLPEELAAAVELGARWRPAPRDAGSAASIRVEKRFPGGQSFPPDASKPTPRFAHCCEDQPAMRTPGPGAALLSPTSPRSGNN